MSHSYGNAHIGTNAYQDMMLYDEEQAAFTSLVLALEAASRDLRELEPPCRPAMDTDWRVNISAKIASELEPSMREPQVVGLAPMRRLARGATPQRFAYYQGAA